MMKLVQEEKRKKKIKKSFTHWQFFKSGDGDQRLVIPDGREDCKEIHTVSLSAKWPMSLLLPFNHNHLVCPDTQSYIRKHG